MLTVIFIRELSGQTQSVRDKGLAVLFECYQEELNNVVFQSLYFEGFVQLWVILGFLLGASRRIGPQQVVKGQRFSWSGFYNKCSYVIIWLTYYSTSAEQSLALNPA